MDVLDKESIYAEFHGKVLSYINGKTNDIHIAEDICSDVFLKIYEKLDTYDKNKASLSTWIFRITVNTLTDYYRTRHVHSELPIESAASDSVEDEVINEQTLSSLAAALKSIDERERDIIIMKYYSGMTLVEIAKKMQISYAYVKTLHNKALQALKKKMQT